MNTINHVVEIIPAYMHVELHPTHKIEKEVPARKRVKTIVITRDTLADSPREWDNLGTMYCWHRNYTLGDEQPKCDPNEQMIKLICEYDPEFEERFERACEFSLYLTTEEQRKEYRRWYQNYIDDNFSKHYIWQNLYLYDHSGISMSVGKFSCPWDSGQVGFIAVAKEKVRAEYDWKRITQKRLEKIQGYLKGEVEFYSSYLEGDVWGFQIYVHDLGEDPTEGEEVDSCWGFYGSERETNGMTDHWPDDWKDTCGITVKFEGAELQWEVEHALS
jgi:hypothetical protein